MKLFEIKPFQDHYRDQMIEVWERSVLATHHFLTPADFETIRNMVLNIDFKDFEVYCLMSYTEVVGFIGVTGSQMEMLFLAPEYHGMGLGKKLITFAIDELKTNPVEVNEQNYSAVEFYQHFGFKTYERTEQDSQGMDYPILKMKLTDTNG